MRTRPPYLIASVLVLQSAALGWLAYSMVRLGHAIDRPAPASAETPRAPAPAPTASAAPVTPQALMPAIASLGEGRLVYASPDGKLVLVGRDHVSGELVVEKVYALERDELRNLGDDARRVYSGYYLVDVERARRQNVVAQEALFNDAVVKAGDRADALDRCIDAARWLAEAGGIDRLRKRLDDRNALARHAAAFALAERGYYAAIPDLVNLVDTSGDNELSRRAVILLRDLTGLPLGVDDERTSTARRADDWWKKNQPEDPYARRLPAPR